MGMRHCSSRRYNDAMNPLKGILTRGIAIYAVMYLTWSGLVIYGLAAGYVSLMLRVLALALVTTIAARSLQVVGWKGLLPYALGWAAVAAVLDAVFLVPFSGWTLYTSWSLWVGYALVAVFPLAFAFVRSPKSSQV